MYKALVGFFLSWYTGGKDIHTYHRMELLVSASFTCALLAFLLAGATYKMQHVFGLIPTVLVCGGFLILCNPFVLRYTGDYSLAGTLFTAEVLGILTWIIAADEGYMPAPMLFLPAVPMLAAFLVGPWLGIFTAVMIVVEIITFFSLVSDGYMFPHNFTPAQEQFLDLMVLCALVLYSAFIGWMYESQSIRSLRYVNRELKKAHHQLTETHTRLEERVKERTAALAQANGKLKREITERRRIEMALRENELRFRKLVQNASDLITVIDLEGMILYESPSVERVLGYNMEQRMGQNAFGFIHEEDRADLRDKLNAGLNGSDALIRAQYRMRHSDGHWLHMDGIGRFLLDDPTIKGIVLNSRDITDQKKYELGLFEAGQKAEAATKAKSAFLATMSHEIRTPLNGVIGMTDLLLETGLSPDQEEYAQIIQTSGENLLNIINDILDFSKIEAGKLELEHEPYDVRAAVAQALTVIAPSAHQKALELILFVDQQVPHQIMGDVTRIRQILINLLSNAVKFTNAGEVFVSVTVAEPMAGRPLQVRFAVKDSGIGIPQARMDRLFQSFSQVDSSTTRKYGGTGLGLAISKELCEMMQGRIEVESEVGYGSTFSFTLPVEAASSKKPYYLQSEHPALEGKHVLILDDNETGRNITALICETWGLIPVATSTPEEARQRMADATYDLLLFDYDLPGTDGLAVARQLKKATKKNLPPLVLFSRIGALGPDVQSDPLVFKTVAKPVQPKVLYKCLLAGLSNERSVPETAASAPPVVRELEEKQDIRILIAEDNMVNQRVFTHMFRMVGHDVEFVMNGQEAVDAAAAHTFDVIFMDMQMPVMDGLEAVRKIRSTGDTTYIIALTANASESDRQRCLIAGMDDYLSKPLQIEDLKTALKSVPALSV